MNNNFGITPDPIISKIYMTIPYAKKGGHGLFFMDDLVADLYKFATSEVLRRSAEDGTPFVTMNRVPRLRSDKEPVRLATMDIHARSVTIFDYLESAQNLAKVVEAPVRIISKDSEFAESDGCLSAFGKDILVTAHSDIADLAEAWGHSKSYIRLHGGLFKGPKAVAHQKAHDKNLGWRKKTFGLTLVP